MGIRNFAGCFSALILCSLYGILFGIQCFFFYHDKPLSPLVFAIISFFIIVFILLCIGVNIICHRLNLDKKGYGRSLALLLIAVPLLFSLIDIPPVEHDYEIENIAPADPNILPSYHTLMVFSTDSGIDIPETIPQQVFAQIKSNPRDHSRLIRKIWDSIAEARSALEKLDTFSGITDFNPNTEIGLDAPVLSYFKIRNTAMAYAAYAYLKTAEGHSDVAAKEIAKLQSVINKALPNTVALIDKIIWFGVARISIDAAYGIMQSPQCTPDALETLKKVYTPISTDTVSLRKPLIGDYLAFKNFCKHDLNASNFMDWMERVHLYKAGNKPRSFIRNAASGALFYLTFRKYRTLKLSREFTEMAVRQDNKFPEEEPNVELSNKELAKHPDFFNLGGWYVLSNIGNVNIKYYHRRALRTRVLSDLIATEIGNRLKSPIALVDFYSNGPYRYNAALNCFFSYGPDRKPYTDDDISLVSQKIAE